MTKSSPTFFVGLHKTGSSFLQRALPQAPVDFVQLGEEGLLEYLRSDPEFTPDEFRHRLGCLQGVTGARPLVVSSEGLSGTMFGHDRIEPVVAADRIKLTWPSARIVIVVRRQWDYLLSAYGFHVVRRFEAANIGDFLDREGPRGLYAKLEYDKLVHCYQERFGAGRVKVLPMEWMSAEPENFLADLCRFIGVSAPDGLVVERVNQSTRIGVLLQTMRWSNRLLRRPIKRMRRQRRTDWFDLKESIAAWGNRSLDRFSRIEVPGRIISQLESTVSNSNARLSELADLDLAKWNYPLPSD